MLSEGATSMPQGTTDVLPDRASNMPDVASAEGQAAGLANLNGMTTADITALTQKQAVGDNALANAFIWTQARLELQLNAIGDGIHRLTDLQGQAVNRGETNRAQAETTTNAILGSILNATVAKNLRNDQDSQGAGDAGSSAAAPQVKPCVVDFLPKEIFEPLATKYGKQEYHNATEHMELEEENSQEHSNYQTAMFHALSAHTREGFEMDGWIPIVELHRRVSARGNYPKATLEDIFAIAFHEKSKGQHRYGDKVYKLYHMTWQEDGHGMNYNSTFIKLGSKKEYNAGGGWENYNKKRPYPAANWQQ